MTNGEFVSRVINGLSFLNKDEHVSRRYILSVGQNKSKFYISQKLSDKSLFREANLFKTIECFPLKEESTIKCGIYEFSRCETLMKSKFKIPGLIFNKLGSSIISVTSIDGEVNLIPTTLKSFSISKDRVYSKLIKQKFYYIQDGYLYIPDSEVEAVTITYIPFDESGISSVSCDSSNNCKSIWDLQFIVPDKLSEQVIQETINEVSTLRKVQSDENPNLNKNEK